MISYLSQAKLSMRPGERISSQRVCGAECVYRLGNDASGVLDLVKTLLVDEDVLDIFYRGGHGLVNRNGRSDDEEGVHVGLGVLAKMYRR
ncbi:hypothetical protein DICSQDRAFT_148591 [Dichomitus squalens LYAD-421 SS1]|uniref:Uncharacterized protein n=2 Tax=Dichomitus squalens TaxID=114155 RepID=A0A4Q9PPI2_9APHY|nr:uncharacterized protein DICSQDRAFT_148591 [Dichomitus squalens LYAD-421 SS1]EJF59208.1 hypothetical protein DICSQDRAFT_148591 [Dichomitus squalens LYAD-421 SS1]TBU56166.1 hypothetical protein BD310DRAFT_824382 [Dichomitus squalens]